MLQKLRSHLLLALTFFAFTLIQQYAFFAFTRLPIVLLAPGKYLAVFLFFLAATFIKGHKLRFTFLSFIMTLNFFQMAHLSFFGTQILPAEIYLLFTQLHEISGTLQEELRHILYPLAFTVIPLSLGWKAHRKLRPPYRWRFFEILFSLYLIYNPLRTYITGNTWGRQPSTRELTGMNLYLTLSYFTGKILPHKLTKTGASVIENSSLRLKLEREADPTWDKVVVVLGESHTPHHMSLFGYDRPTTNYLNGLKNDPNFFYTIGLSGGVSTDISVAFFFNLGFGAAGAPKAAKGEHCLFKLAKHQGYGTHFLSTQSDQQLRYITPFICSPFVDNYQALEQVSPKTLDHNAAADRDLLPALKQLLASKNKEFILLHQRGSHSPLNLRYSESARLFIDKKDDPRLNDYDNSLVEFDLFWKEFDELLKKTSEKVLVLYLSDHGEYVGEDGFWGHGFMRPKAFEIPILILSYNQELPSLTRKLPKFTTHYNLGLFLAQQLGHKSNQSPLDLPSDYVIYGNDIDGFAGKADVKFNGEEYTFTFSP